MKAKTLEDRQGIPVTSKEGDSHWVNKKIKMTRAEENERPYQPCMHHTQAGIAGIRFWSKWPSALIHCIHTYKLSPSSTRPVV